MIRYDLPQTGALKLSLNIVLEQGRGGVGLSTMLSSLVKVMNEATLSEDRLDPVNELSSSYGTVWARILSSQASYVLTHEMGFYAARGLATWCEEYRRDAETLAYIDLAHMNDYLTLGTVAFSDVSVAGGNAIT